MRSIGWIRSVSWLTQFSVWHECRLLRRCFAETALGHWVSAGILLFKEVLYCPAQRSLIYAPGVLSRQNNLHCRLMPISPFTHLQVPRALVCESFAVFARAEYALKEAGFCKPRHSRDNGAEPDWDRFAREIANKFEVNQSQEVSEAIDYLLKQPPQRQVIQNGVMTWRPIRLNENFPLSGQVLQTVRMVRNNLFHGGKHTPHSPPGRDEKLVRSALEVAFY